MHKLQGPREKLDQVWRLTRKNPEYAGSVSRPVAEVPPAPVAAYSYYRSQPRPQAPPPPAAAGYQLAIPVVPAQSPPYHYYFPTTAPASKRASLPKKRVASKPMGDFCWDFRRTGQCPRGRLCTWKHTSGSGIVCRFFPKCTNQNCRFVHPYPQTAAAEETKLQASDATKSKQTAVTAKSTRAFAPASRVQRQTGFDVCWDFARKGWCPRSTTCQWKHIRPSATAPVARTQRPADRNAASVEQVQRAENTEDNVREKKSEKRDMATSTDDNRWENIMGKEQEQEQEEQKQKPQEREDEAKEDTAVVNQASADVQKDVGKEDAGKEEQEAGKEKAEPEDKKAVAASAGDNGNADDSGSDYDDGGALQVVD